MSDTDCLLKHHAKIDYNIFAEYVIKDARGKRILQGEIHKEMQWHIEECKRRSQKFCGILAPWGHGKTEQVIIGRVLDDIGKSPNDRIAIVTNTDDNSKARVSSITRYICYDDDYKSVYPHVKPAQNSDWSKHKIIVERDSRAKDGTLEAWGVMSSGTGSRFDKIYFDDIIDQRNAIANPALRPAVKENFNNVWLSRLTPDGMVVYIATIWHQDDNTSDIKRNPEWKFLEMKISEDFESIECESPFKGKYRIPVWQYWNSDKLKSRFKVIGKRAFNRGFRQQPLTDEDRTFPSSELIFNKDIDGSIVQPHWARCVGIDPFGQAVVIFTIAINPYNHRKFVVEIKRGKWAPSRTKQEIISVWQRHKPQVIVCENNAAQEAIIEWVQDEPDGSEIPIIPFVTGKQKADPELGLPSLEIEFANGNWVVPYAQVDEFDAEDPVNIWRKEMMDHPLVEKEDTVMASWFAREGARFLLGYKPEEDNNVIHQDEMGVESVHIGDYD